MGKVKPISTREVDKLKKAQIPDVVIEVFNSLIVKNMRGGQSSFLQKDVVELIVAKGISEEKLFENHWLDVEDYFRDYGWDVEYDKPGYNEEWFEPSFKFSKK